MNVFRGIRDFIGAQQETPTLTRYEAPAANVYQVPASYYQQLNQAAAPQQYAPQQVQYDAQPLNGLDALAAYGRQISGMGTRAPMAPMVQPQAQQSFNIQNALQNAMASRAAMQNTGVAVTGDAMRRAAAEMNPATALSTAYYDAGGDGGDGGVGGGSDGSEGDGSDGDGSDGSDGGDGAGDGGDGGGDGGDGGGERAGGLIMNAAREKALKAYRKGDLTFKQLCKALA